MHRHLHYVNGGVCVSEITVKHAIHTSPHANILNENVAKNTSINYILQHFSVISDFCQYYVIPSPQYWFSANNYACFDIYLCVGEKYIVPFMDCIYTCFHSICVCKVG